MTDQEKPDVRDRPGPEPERLKLPYEDWKEALKELFKKPRPADMPPPPEEQQEKEDEDGD